MLPASKILVVDDEPRMCHSLKLLLNNSGHEVQTSNNGHEAIKCLAENSFDLVFLDIVLPDMDGFQIMDHINQQYPDVMVIIITGHVSMESTLRALRRGAYDYIRKPFEPEELLTKGKNAINQKKLTCENRSIYGKLEESEKRYRYLIQNSPDIIYTLDNKGNFTFISDVVEHLTGLKAKQLIGKHYTTIIYEKDLEKANWFFNERRTDERVSNGELRIKVCKTSNRFDLCEVKYLTMELKSTGMYDGPTAKNSKHLGAYGILRDITDRKRLEAQLQDAQRMESLGTLSGGIAHDFNNLLMAIQGNISLMLLDVDFSHLSYQKLKNIETYVQRGANLTKQLLGFARGGKYEVKPSDLNKVINNQNRMFSYTQKQINVHAEYEKNLWTVEIDQKQIEQVLLNLYINASQAMPVGGDLYVRTENLIINENYIKHHHTLPGKYVKISVTDTGIGMNKATQKRIFDPFFTTKEIGKGTGLGLASVYGIIKNHKGFITVSSKEGKGSTFIIYLPASEKEIIEGTGTEAVARVVKDIKNSQTVLLIDDEHMIVEVGKEMLVVLGYEVLTAKSGEKGVEVYKQNKDRVHLVILDMVMPNMGGTETYYRIKEINPDIKFLLSSGYSVNKEASKIVKGNSSGFIQKPFTINQLSEKVTKILDQKPA
ncbi:MAG: response regulator [Deltaproteobacteria bacterium]|nr:response regulator [Deltaproteobacteria bacterium]MBW1931780.1 response regulator [Deltaproteobacteria bacterium]MBW2079444.1 response regulator [Deltaproteobacteria bacterium]MBW2349901.1 response regulator [Deltaproteobacteria bacterium]